MITPLVFNVLVVVVVVVAVAVVIVVIVVSVVCFCCCRCCSQVCLGRQRHGYHFWCRLGSTVGFSRCHSELLQWWAMPCSLHAVAARPVLTVLLGCCCCCCCCGFRWWLLFPHCHFTARHVQHLFGNQVKDASSAMWHKLSMMPHTRALLVSMFLCMYLVQFGRGRRVPFQ